MHVHGINKLTSQLQTNLKAFLSLFLLEIGENGCFKIRLSITTVVKIKVGLSNNNVDKLNLKVIHLWVHPTVLRAILLYNII